MAVHFRDVDRSGPWPDGSRKVASTVQPISPDSLLAGLRGTASAASMLAFLLPDQRNAMDPAFFGSYTGALEIEKEHHRILRRGHEASDNTRARRAGNSLSDQSKSRTLPRIRLRPLRSARGKMVYQLSGSAGSGQSAREARVQQFDFLVLRDA